MLQPESPPSASTMPRRLSDYQRPLLVVVLGMLLSSGLSVWIGRHGLSVDIERWLPVLALSGGILISALVAGLFVLTASLRIEAEKRARGMTAALRKRENRLLSTLNSLDEWVFVLSPEGDVLDCHEPGTGGWQTRNAFIGQPLTASLPASSAAEFSARLQEALHEGQAHFEFELPGVAKTRHLMAHLTTCHRDGQPNGITMVARDISSERARVAVLAASEKKFRLLFAQAPEAIVLMRHNHYVDANAAALTFFGVPNLATLQHADVSVLSPLMQSDRRFSRDVLKEMMEKAQAEGPQHFEWTFQRLSDAEALPSEVHCNHMEINGEAHFLSIISDLSARKQTELTLIQALDEAEAATNEKSEFLATMSHEIRTPMNGVLGMTQLLSNTELNPEQRDYLITIQQSGQALLTIINDILDFSRIEAGKLSFEEVPFDLQVAVDETCELLLPQIREKNLTLTLALAPDTPFYVIGDAGRFRQLLLNYLSNALKFTQKGGITVALHAREAGRGAAFYELSVADTGIGIRPEKQEVLFQRFAQADTTITRRFGGTGLGLAICKALVERMGGEVSMASTPGHGSTFRATFWMSLDPHGDQQVLPVLATALRHIPVLVIDAVASNRELLVQGLAKAGLAVTATGSVAEAILAVREQPPRFVLLDTELPDGDADSLIQALRAESDMQDATLILLSSRPERNDPAFCRRQGVAACLPKPARISWLVGCLNILAGGEFEGVVTRHTLLAHHGRGMALPGLRTGIRVLLVEDNAVNQKVAARMLEKMGCHVDMAGNGLEALVMAAQLPYDVILMDVQMPEMDGISATRKLRAQGFTKLPIIALTANSRDSDRQECRAAGMNDFLAKPIRYEDLHACLDRWV